MSDLFRFLNEPYILFTGGIFVIFLAGVYTYIGKVWVRTRCVSRADEPKQYWLELAMLYLLGIGLIGYFFYVLKLSRSSP
jgi:hypothetical protein